MVVIIGRRDSFVLDAIVRHLKESVLNVVVISLMIATLKPLNLFITWYYFFIMGFITRIILYASCVKIASPITDLLRRKSFSRENNEHVRSVLSAIKR